MVLTILSNCRHLYVTKAPNRKPDQGQNHIKAKTISIIS